MEATFGVGGVLGSLDVRWGNHPNRAAASYKPVQLATAARCGLDVPTTLITNTREAATRFASRCGAGRMVTKMLGANHIEEEGSKFQADPADKAGKALRAPLLGRRYAA